MAGPIVGQYGILDFFEARQIHHNGIRDVAAAAYCSLVVFSSVLLERKVPSMPEQQTVSGSSSIDLVDLTHTSGQGSTCNRRSCRMWHNQQMMQHARLAPLESRAS